MSARPILIVIDDFSERSLDYENVTLYDYGLMERVAFVDNYFDVYTGQYSGYGNYDDIITLESKGYGFFKVTPDSDGFYSYTRDFDYVSSGQFVDSLGYTAFYDEYWTFDRVGQASEAQANHGDWVVEAINSTLDDPSAVEIICFDIDLLNGDHFDELFQRSVYDFLGETFFSPAIEVAILDFLLANDTRLGAASSTSFVIGGVTMSVGGNFPTFDQFATLDLLDGYGIPFFQSAPNVNQVGYDWSSVYPEVITVGAWNVNAFGDLITSFSGSLGNLDILADGYIEKDLWGENFGTSFATPRVAAAWINELSQVLAQLAPGELGYDFGPGQILNTYGSNLEFEILDALAVSILSTINGSEIQIPVLSDTFLDNGSFPTTYPEYVPGLGLYVSSAIPVSDGIDNLPTRSSDFASLGNRDNFYVALEGDDIVFGDAGDDLIVGVEGNDKIFGGAGFDTAAYLGQMESFTVSITRDAVIVTDRSGTEGVDELRDVEAIFFNRTEWSLSSFDDSALLSEASFTSLAEMYIAYFNRAPDSQGLLFWADSLAQGVSLEVIAAEFFASAEAAAAYPDRNNMMNFVETVYNNVLGRPSDAGGLAYWVDILERGITTPEAFIVNVLDAAKAHTSDRLYLENKADVGIYFSAIKGISDGSKASDVMNLYDGSAESILAAKELTDEYHAAAIDSNTGDFLVNLVGVVSDPFADLGTA